MIKEIKALSYFYQY